MKKLILALLSIGFLFSANGILAQSNNNPKKELNVDKINSPIKIDGVLDEMAWNDAEVAKDFIDNTPNPGAQPLQKTEVRVLYDDVGVYVGAILHESAVDSILKQLCIRDEGNQSFGGDPFSKTNTDWFGIGFDNYMDGINGVFFAVSAAGVQFDLKLSADGADKNWDAVWDSEIQMHDDKWVVEMSIPFSALRFPSAEKQEWHMNFTRGIRRNRSQSWWNPIKPEVEGFFNQFGLLKGIENIKSPVRLQATPYFSMIGETVRDVNGDPVNDFGGNIGGGVDIKYGLNDAFTLDMTLIPNFADVAQDDQVLNLSAFEVRFNENRPFFTEGTELFNKGNLFYSRRIGGRPLKASSVYDNLGDEETVVSNAIETPLYNALKLSGRTGSGLGIGVFNAIVGKTFATIKDGVTGEQRKQETNPVTNYNVLVFDQNLKNNSFITLINANTTRFGKDYDANVTGTVFNVNNKSNTFSVSGSAKLSQIFNEDAKTDLGHAYDLELEKTGGKLTYGMYYNVESDTYDPNDLGFLRSNNERSSGVFASFNQYEPFGNFLRSRASISVGHSMLYEPDLFTDFFVELNNHFVYKTFFSFGYSVDFSPLKSRDYFDPRQNDGFQTYLEIPEYVGFGGWVSSDYRKKFAYDIRGRYIHVNQEGRYEWSTLLSPRFRFSDKLFMVLASEYTYEGNNMGFVSFDSEGNSIIGTRNTNTVENSISADYIFNNKMGVTLNARHYWSKVNYNDYDRLSEKGVLTPFSDFDTEGNVSYNAFTIDMIYRWRFAPGSDLVLVWKNGIFTNDSNETDINYFQNFKLFGKYPQSNTLSLKILYFLDYYTLKNKWTSRKKRKNGESMKIK